MKYIMYNHTPLRSNVLRILLIFLMCGILQGIAGAMPETAANVPVEPLPNTTKVMPDEPKLPIYAANLTAEILTFFADWKVSGKRLYDAISQDQTLHILIIAGIFVLIGTLLSPHICPQIAEHQKRIVRFLDHTVKPHQHFAGQAAVIEMRGTAVSFQHPGTVPIQPRRRGASQPVPSERILRSTPKRQRQKPAPAGIIGAFFQQSGFIVTAVSDTELRVSSQLASYISYGDIPVYMMNNTVVDQRHIQQIYTNMTAQNGHTQGGTSGRQKMAFIVVNAPLEECAYQQIYSYKIRHDLTIIPLSQLLVAKSVRHASCAQQLAEKISASTGTCNLYAMNTPVADPLNFFGRTKIMNQLLDAIGQHQHIGLFGTPKIGKTWLFWQLKERLAANITIYIDLRQLPKSCSYLYRKILDECVRDIGFKYPSLELPQLHLTWTDSNDCDAQEFFHDLVTLWKHVQQKQSQARIILLLDGAEHLLPKKGGTGKTEQTIQEFMTTLHTVAQQHHCLTSMMAFTSPQAMRQTLPIEWHCGRKFALASLTEEQCNQMITSLGAQIGLRYSEETLSRLYYATGGHPYVTRQVCSLIAKNLRRSKMIPLTRDMEDYTAVQVRDVEQAVAEYLEYKSDYLEGLWQQLLPTEQELLRIIASQNSCSRDELMEHSGQKPSGRRYYQAIQSLLANDVMEKCEDKYAIKMGLFEQVISTY